MREESSSVRVRLKQRAGRVRLQRARRGARLPAPVEAGSEGWADSWRLVRSPVFVLSHYRSGSTLLRAMLNSHPDICAPHEMHLGSFRVVPGIPVASGAIAQLGYTEQRLADMLWDRVLFDQLMSSGKSVIVDKTPQNTDRWRRIVSYWPEARFVFLRRHPVRVLESVRDWRAGEPDFDERVIARTMTRFARKMAAAQNEHGGFALTYEELTREPERVIGSLCEFLEVPWSADVISYGRKDHGPWLRGLGDWGAKIRSGTIAAAPPDPDYSDVPEFLRPVCDLMGYGPA